MSHAYRVVLAQVAIGLLCALAFLTAGRHAASSATLAVLSVGLPALYYAWVQSRTYSAARLLMHGVLKTVLTAILIAVSIVVFGIEPLGFFVTFSLMQLGYLLRQRSKSSE